MSDCAKPGVEAPQTPGVWISLEVINRMLGHLMQIPVAYVHTEPLITLLKEEVTKHGAR